MKFGSMPCETLAKTGGSYIPGDDAKAASVSGFFLV